MPDLSTNIPRVSIVMLNHNGLAVTLAAVESLKRQTYPNFRLYLIDNGSTEQGLREAVQGDDRVVFLRSETNLGFVKGSNLGIKIVLSEGTDYILLLNNDVVLHGDLIAELVRCAESDPSVGAVSPKIYFADPHRRIWFAGGWFRPWAGFARMRGWRKKDSPALNTRSETDWISGCAFMARADVIRKVGLMDERLDAENEDLDWSLRIRKAGYRLIYCPEAVLWHQVGYTHVETGKDFTRDRRCVRNLLLVLREHLGTGRFLAALPTFALVWFGIIPFRHALNGEYSMMAQPYFGAVDYVRLVLRGVQNPMERQ